MSAACTPVPMLDVNRQNQPLREEMLAAVASVCDSGAFLHGPPDEEQIGELYREFAASSPPLTT